MKSSAVPTLLVTDVPALTLTLTLMQVMLLMTDVSAIAVTLEDLSEDEVNGVERATKERHALLDILLEKLVVLSKLLLPPPLATFAKSDFIGK